MYSYRVFGLNLYSQLQLPELSPACFAEPDVRIQLAEVPDTLPQPLKLRPRFDLSAKSLLLRIPGVGRFYVDSGRLIHVAPVPEANAKNLRRFLLGSCLGAVLQQRGLMPLHAGAIDTPTGAVLICGNSGAGKSTATALLASRGFAILTDDVAALQVKRNHVVLEPGYPQLKLWKNSMSQLRLNPEAHDVVRPGREKYVVKISRGFVLQPRPVAALVQLYPTDIDAPRLRLLSGGERIVAMKRNVYRKNYLAPSQGPDYFRQYVQFAQSFPAYELQRPEHGNSMEEVADLIEQLSERLSSTEHINS